MLVLFWTLTALYFIVGARVDQWATHQVIGLPLEVPPYFHKRPQAYALVRTLLLLGAVGALFLSGLAWYYGIAVLAAAWLGTTWLGQRMAFARYRKIALELARTAETEQERAANLERAQKSDAELRDMAMTMAKFAR